MSNTNLPPFYAGQKVVSLIGWEDARRIYGYNYPSKGQVVVVQGIESNGHGGWHIQVPNCEVVLWYKHFAPIEENFQSISLEKVLEKETPLIGIN
jgi:hypothetical protein